ncbi:patatin family protein [Corynebacterium timonense]|uniref:Predicted phospholipase, patatin/cPLA2 family n=1 Tax=Corynebacterium timonense TaxID=441500 RepID=A0A1H1QTK9_9CORY|nr:patatin family protein [Corynebacterium timonense]SDS26706.1 Predicted phospholipase, patatin/cPLA2 family [Corynebacterium timonense]
MIDARDTALIFEGGGMRNSYTSPCVVKLIEEDVQFGWVGGVSAGATHTVNYLSRDLRRARESFVDFANNPSFGGVSSLLRGNGYFNAEYIYERSADGDLPFDYDAFEANPAQMTISATRADTGESVHFTREDIRERSDMNSFVRASSTLPLIMPKRYIGGVPYVDGALGASGGISIAEAEDAGYEKFLFVATKPRGYVRPQVNRQNVVRRVFRNTPAVAQAIIDRPGRYNASKQRLLELEKEGRAQLFFPDDMQVNSTERNVVKLRANFSAGERQMDAEWGAWQEFLAA